MAKILVRGGTVIDGMNEPRRADVAIRDGRIVEVGPDLAFDGEVVDAGGLTVIPGIVDVHTHSDPLPFLPAPDPFKLVQGITTEVFGNCGSSHGGLREHGLADIGVADPFPDEVSRAQRFTTYPDLLERRSFAVNGATLVGHSTLRAWANGPGKQLRPGSLERMVEGANEAIDAGAAGISFGLEYAPGSYAEPAELVALAAVAAQRGRLVAAHTRNEAELALTAVDELLEVAAKSGAALHLSHLKVSGPQAHGGAGKILARIKAAREAGLDVSCDIYPYAACSTELAALLPTIARAEGDSELPRVLADPARRHKLELIATAEKPEQGAGIWRETTPHDILIVMHADPALEGRRLSDVLDGRRPWDALCDILIADTKAFAVLETMADADVQEFLRAPGVMVASDSVWPVDHGHPRTWGCFPHLLGHYVRELGVLSLQDAVERITSAPARRFGLSGRGLLGTGAIADIAVIDSATIGHTADMTAPNTPPRGVQHVLIGGGLALADGRVVNPRLGRLLRREG